VQEETSLITQDEQEKFVEVKADRVTRLTEKSLLQQVSVCQPPIIPKILTICIKRCVKEKIYGLRPVHKIVETIEKTWRKTKTK